MTAFWVITHLWNSGLTLELCLCTTVVQHAELLLATAVCCELLVATVSCVTTGNCRILWVTTGNWELLVATTVCCELLVATTICCDLVLGTGSYWCQLQHVVSYYCRLRYVVSYVRLRQNSFRKINSGCIIRAEVAVSGPCLLHLIIWAVTCGLLCLTHSNLTAHVT